MPISRFLSGAACLALLTATAAAASVASAQSTDLYSEMHWREIGPTRAGRARALAGVPSQPNVFYVGFDNGGVWRSTDYGSNWVPLFDHAADRIDRRDRRRAVRSEHHLRRHRRRNHPARSRQLATACTSPPTPARRGRTSAFATAR